MLIKKTPNRQDPYWILYIKNRIKNMKNFLGITTGPTGSGKSWSALSICLMADPTFTPERIVFSMKELMKLINEGDLKSGSAILWDEAGIDASNRSWQSLTNKMINFLLQTFRHKRIILIMTTPYLDFVDSNTRKLFHAEITTEKIYKDKKEVQTKPMVIQYNSKNKKFYYKYLRVNTGKGTSPVKKWNIPKPPQWLVDEYEELKTKFTSALNKDIEKQLNPIILNPNDKRKPLTEKQEQVLKLLAKNGGDMNKVVEKIGITHQTAYFHKDCARKKGYSWEEYA